jgi:hypothetical protein
MTEAQAVVIELDVSYRNISNLAGIKSFTNLKKLNCIKNNLITLDVSGMVNLQEIACNQNNITSINLGGLVNLANLYCGPNNLTTIDLSGLGSLYHAYLGENNLTSITLNGTTNLTHLYLASNQFTSINLSGLLYLKYLDLGDNQFSSLQISNLPSLEIFSFINNNLPATLNFTVLPNLETIYAANSKLTSIGLNGIQTLKILECSSNQLNSLSFQDGFLQNMQYLNVDNNPMQFICKDSYDVLPAAASVPQLINACVLSTKEATNEQVKLMINPNPAKEYINLNHQVKEIKIFTMDGKIMLDKKDNKELKINIANLPTGVYILKTELGNAKFIKE